MIEQRITNLEIKFSHQEDYLQKLNEVIIAQQDAVTRMEKEILDLKRSVNQDGGVQGKSLQDEKPPHY